jgi:two-component system, LuxR family, sensor kinase FixL
MNWMTITWPMVAAACLTLGLIELGIGLAQRPRVPRLLFALSAFIVTCVAGLELALMQTDDLAKWWLVTRLLDTAVGLMLVSLTAFIWNYFGTGRKWLALAIPFIYAIGLSFDFFPGTPPGVGMTYQAFIGFRTVETFGGATFYLAEGVPNPWNVFPYLAVLALIVFVADASIRLWHLGGGRRAVLVGGAIVLFLLAGGLQAALVDVDILKTPYMISWAYLAVLIAMSIELNVDVLAGARLARQLQESERRMELAGAAADLGMWTWDIGHDTFWATGRARAMFGFTESEHIDRARFLGALHPDDRQATDKAVEDALATDLGYNVEYRVCLPDGKMRWIAARGQVDRDERGEPILLRGVVLDISDRRGGELELQQLRSQLAHASRVSMLGQLASALAHELSQPLGAILRNTEAAELFLEHDPPDLDELRAILVDIRLDDQRAGSVIDRLRALLKRRSFAPRALSVSDELENVAALTLSDSVTRKVALKIEAAPDLPPVTGDPVHLQQVLLNLIINAMDAVDDVAALKRKVTVRAERHGDTEIEVAVEDSGPGIAPERLGRLFEPFFTTKANGMGIGLAISRTIIEAHGGRIWAENNAGEGATFRFTLPLAAAATPS